MEAVWRNRLGIEEQSGSWSGRPGGGDAPVASPVPATGGGKEHYGQSKNASDVSRPAWTAGQRGLPAAQRRDGGGQGARLFPSPIERGLADTNQPVRGRRAAGQAPAGRPGPACHLRGGGPRQPPPHHGRGHQQSDDGHAVSLARADKCGWTEADRRTSVVPGAGRGLGKAGEA